MKFCTLNKTICIFFLSTLHLIYIKKEIYLYSKQGWLESLRTTWELWNSSFTLLSNMYRESHLQAYSFQSSRFLLVYFYFRGLASILSLLPFCYLFFRKNCSLNFTSGASKISNSSFITLHLRLCLEHFSLKQNKLVIFFILRDEFLCSLLKK